MAGPINRTSRTLKPQDPVDRQQGGGRRVVRNWHCGKTILVDFGYDVRSHALPSLDFSILLARKIENRWGRQTDNGPKGPRNRQT
jgi:hypothetical protein